MALIDAVGAGPVGVDTSIFIYFIEEDPRFLPLIAPLFHAADEGRKELVASSLTLLEVLVVPYRAGNLALARRYELLLTRGRGIRMIDLMRNHMHEAARLRAATAMRTSDALQIVAAHSAGCSAFVTNDRRLPAIPGFRVVQLSEIVT